MVPPPCRALSRHLNSLWCWCVYLPSELRALSSKADPRVRYGVFVGHRLKPGCRWPGEHLVFDLDVFVNKDLGVGADVSSLRACKSRRWTSARRQATFPPRQEAQCLVSRQTSFPTWHRQQPRRRRPLPASPSASWRTRSADDTLWANSDSPYAVRLGRLASLLTFATHSVRRRRRHSLRSMHELSLGTLRLLHFLPAHLLTRLNAPTWRAELRNSCATWVNTPIRRSRMGEGAAFALPKVPSLCSRQPTQNCGDDSAPAMPCVPV